MKTCLVCGYNDDFRMGEETNNINNINKNIISPPILFKYDASKILSFSTFYQLVVVTIDGIAHGIGDNTDGQISWSLPHEKLDHFIDIELKDSEGLPCAAKSAVCGGYYTLYLISPTSRNGRNQLAFSHSEMETKFPTVLDIGEVTPVSLFGGNISCASIDTEGGIIYINGSHYLFPTYKIERVFLPFNEKAASVACCDGFVISLSTNGRIFESKNVCKPSFTEVSELRGTEISFISGIKNHCLAVSKDGRVFVRGHLTDDNFGQLSLGKNTKEASKFTEISSLRRYKISEAYAGAYHSLFRTREGKILACGYNLSGELLLSCGPSKEKIYEPVETTVRDATFCIAGCDTTAVFMNCQSTMNPNKRIDFEIKTPTSKPKPSKQAKVDTENSILNEKISKPEKQLTEKNEEIKKQKSLLDEQKKKYESQLSQKNEEIKEQKSLFDEQKKKYESQLSQKNEEIKKQKSLLDEQKKKYESQLSQKNEEIKRLQKTQSKGGQHEIELLDGSAIDALERLEEISFGSSGKVFKVAKKIIYALKEMKTSITAEEFRQFLQEYELLCRLLHPNIVKTFGIFLSDKKRPPSILLEFCPTNLERWVKEGKHGKVEIVFFVYEVVEGMKYVHSQKVIHRDLKPTNILIGSDGHIKISDFGISKLMSTEDQSMTGGVGTQRFMAPEILNEEDYNEKVDVYSFGVVLFFILSGGEFPKITVVQVGTGKKAKIPANISPISRELINKCWNFDPKDRPSFKEINEFLESNDYNLMDMDESEIKKVKSKIKLHEQQIPSY